MRSALFLLLSLLLFACVATDARKDPGEYWKIVMNGDPMPKAIADILHVQSSSATDLMNMETDRFIKNFNTKANVIIYHSHDHDHVHVRSDERSEASDVDGQK
ncbi:hypothetical protein Salat_1608400 [Sesamum alatum]|uniref:Uncharacterized protein n=1 Tax=Sesamum alatum TaxID=300844 RepID=A0AAE1Y5J6_9LAMI|nr:hypothetical protein Salat_1608400 [Sesamum alatum]